MSDIIVLETEMGGGQGEEKGWPVEVMVGVGEEGVITLLKRCVCVCVCVHLVYPTTLSFQELCFLMFRDSYRPLCTYQPQTEESFYPGTYMCVDEGVSLSLSLLV